jgi:hypothetical protein
MKITKTLAAAALAISLTTSGAQAGMDTRPEANAGILVGAVILGLIGLLLVTNGNGDNGTTSTKSGPDLGIDLPPQGGKVIASF